MTSPYSPFHPDRFNNLVAVLFGFVIGMLVTQYIAQQEYEALAVRCGLADYDPKTGQLKWRD